MLINDGLLGGAGRDGQLCLQLASSHRGVTIILLGLERDGFTTGNVAFLHRTLRWLRHAIDLDLTLLVRLMIDLDWTGGTFAAL